MKAAAPAGEGPAALAVARDLFERLEALSVPHCHWKSNVRLDASLAGQTDIDLLVDAGRAADCERALRELGYRRFVSPPFACYPGVEDWLGFDPASGELVHVQLHYRLVTGLKFVKEQGLPWTRDALDRAVPDPLTGVRIPPPDFELVMLCARVASKTSRVMLALLGPRATIPAHVREEWSYLRERCDGPQTLRERSGRPLCAIAPDVLDLLVDADPLVSRRTALRLLGKVRRALAPWRTVPLPLAMLRATFFKVYVRFGMATGLLPIRKVPETGGRLVALVGADGAGKSTATASLARWLAWKVDVRTVYLGNDRGGVLAVARWLYRRLRPRPEAGAAPAKREGAPVAGRVPALLRLWNARTRQRRLRRALRMRERGAVVLTDRYPQTAVRGMLDGPAVGNGGDDPLVARVLAHEAACFEQMSHWPPDLVIKFVVDPAVAIARKPDHDPALVRSKCEALSVLEFPGARVVEVDASQPLDVVLATCRRILWNAL